MVAIKKAAAKIPLLIRVVSLYVVVGGSMLGVASAMPDPAPPAEIILASSPVVPESTQTPVITGKPVGFKVQRLGIDLPIKDGVYNSKTREWTLSDNAVYFATITSRPNDIRGNTFLYGHNQPQVIAQMKDIRVGDVATITTANGHTFRYAYKRDSVVAPTFTEVLMQNPDKPQLTVMTCEGIWSETRRLMYFKFLEVV